MRYTFLIAAVLLLGCGSDPNSQPSDTYQSDVHKVVVEEVLQTTNYTYLRVKENDSEQWLAVPKMTSSAGEVYYYKGGLIMTEFVSKELNRTFKSVLLLEKVSSTPEITEQGFPPTSPHGANPHQTIPLSESNTNTASAQKDIKTEPVKGGITIAELFKNKQSYSGKTVKIKGQVTKFTPAIMNKNWLHVQDGTEHTGKFDLTVTTDAEVKVGDTITIEGIITLDKDFGFGYVYEVIMEDAKLVK